MTQFAFTELVNDPHADVVSAALGVDSSNKLNDEDRFKPVKMAAGANYVLCALGDEIEGFVVSTEANTVNDGFSFGSVIRNKRVVAQIATTAVVFGDLVVSDAPAALGTADAYPQVKKAVGTEAGLYNWRVIQINTGTGAIGDLVLLEKI